jgi:hypothetical protein
VIDTELDYVASDLDTPVELQIALRPKTSSVEPISENNTGLTGPYTIKFDAKIPLSNSLYTTINLFYGVFNNLSFTNIGTGDKLYLRYLSDVGLLLHHIGESAESLVTLQSTSSSGQRIVEFLQTHKFKLPGVLESNITPEYFKNIMFDLELSSN